LPRNLADRKQLVNALAEDVPVYNTIRPQLSLQGNTPEETFSGKSLDINHYKTHFDSQKTLRITQKPAK
jgi:putative transposase